MFLKWCFHVTRQDWSIKVIWPRQASWNLTTVSNQENSPVVHYIFTQSVCTGGLPTELTQANVAHILKKDSKLQSVINRPVCLTCITCKLFEHIINTSSGLHFFTDLQHGLGQKDHVKIN